MDIQILKKSTIITLNSTLKIGLAILKKNLTILVLKFEHADLNTCSVHLAI